MSCVPELGPEGACRTQNMQVRSAQAVCHQRRQTPVVLLVASACTGWQRGCPRGVVMGVDGGKWMTCAFDLKILATPPISIRFLWVKSAQPPSSHTQLPSTRPGTGSGARTNLWKRVSGFLLYPLKTEAQEGDSRRGWQICEANRNAGIQDDGHSICSLTAADPSSTNNKLPIPAHHAEHGRFGEQYAWLSMDWPRSSEEKLGRYPYVNTCSLHRALKARYVQAGRQHA